ncbi:Sir2 family NAD-dependent protein deacetylase [Tessaracoccus sp. MC1756]|uniref:Sir2 family NAD-dependent protein deacetylase n=1 Tax=Tessaracoccus sp. MC1756 TaxID=2760311 RepID=UPI0016037D57|nr:Sir2 family NAD-dependent protein deacetylase [Tessaracoccus sp. MC1756]MBB1510586.1 NAD-dependent protein deacetylase [Tessaracoccus sp. MC1756]
MTPRDVGGWFRTAVDGPVVLPDTGAWGPGTGSFGRQSHDDDLRAAVDLFRGRPTMVLTGAGMSTASGLPDYRGRDAVPRSPMMFQEFVGSDLSRRRYWARSTVGWHSFASAEPNDAHHQLARMGRLTPLTGVVTQNVDGLHQKAGSHPVLDLHGTLAQVLCLECGLQLDRHELQLRFLQLNPTFAAQLEQLASNAAAAPDGDAEVDRTQDFVYPGCPTCGGMLKPDVVFFGENAHRDTVAAANALLDESDVLIVLGSSLTVMSGLRFARRAAREGKEVIIANDGSTRGDDVATLRIHGRLEPTLQRWISLLTH